ncbi:MAG: adenylosuccinate synthetase [Thermomicrobiales bacterium]
MLDAFDPIQVGVGYELDGRPITTVPSISTDHDRVQPVLSPSTGWLRTSPRARGERASPRALDYIARIGELAGAPVSMVGVGPDRDQLVPVGDLAGAAVR